MPTLAIYQQADFPTVLKWQAIAFMRGEWPFIFSDEGKFITETYPPTLRPIHFAAAEGDSLISYAALLRLNLDHMGNPYIVYGFGNMFTFAPYRGEGYGRQVLELATRFIWRSEVDLAILFCDSKLEAFYAASGWEAIHSPTRIGQPAHYETHDVVRMMLFVSDKGRQGRADFETQPFYIESPW